MNRSVLALALALAGCVDSSDGELETGDLEQEAAVSVVGRMPSTTRACWVIQHVTITQERIDQVQSEITDWSIGDTGLRFAWRKSNLATFKQINLGGRKWLTNCTRNKLGKWNEELRIYMDDEPGWSSTQGPSTITIPGCVSEDSIGTQVVDQNGVPVQDANGMFQLSRGNWSGNPIAMLADRDCLYNTHIDKGASRNTNLHEVGHALGRAHEQDHPDQNCHPSPYGSIAITTYDRDSVMHYTMTCDDGTTTIGNAGSTGLSAGDKLSMEIMYPATLESRINGSLVSWPYAYNLNAYSNLVMRGAYVWGSNPALKNFVWRIDGSTLSTALSPGWWEWEPIGVGSHVLELQYTDIYGDVHVGRTTVEVLPSKLAYDTRIAAAVQPMF